MDPASRPELSRRSILKMGGVLGTASIGAALPFRIAQADSPPPPAPVCAPERWLTGRAIDPLPLPPLEVIALDRLAFGPRPGDLQVFRSLGATPEECLAAYVDQQLDPYSVDDTVCDAHLAAAGFTTLNKS